MGERVCSGVFIWHWDVTSVDGVYGGIGMPYMHGWSLLDRER